MNIDEEILAAFVHKIWAEWMEYFFTKCYINDKGEEVVPALLVRRWKRQMYSEYIELSEDEKESDREIAQRYIELCQDS